MTYTKKQTTKHAGYHNVYPPKTATQTDARTKSNSSRIRPPHHEISMDYPIGDGHRVVPWRKNAFLAHRT